MKKLIALLSIFVLGSCSTEDPIKYFNCVGEANYKFTISIDTSKKEFIWMDADLPVPYVENNNELISGKEFVDWDLVLKLRKEGIKKMYADGETEHDVDSGWWDPFLNPVMTTDDFEEYKIYTFNKITGELIEDFFIINKNTPTSYDCTATEPAIK